jgi:hypothetical protein
MYGAEETTLRVSDQMNNLHAEFNQTDGGLISQ